MPSIYDHPLYYDILFGWDRDPEALFYDRLFRTHGVRARGRLLELGCGTGQIALRLAEHGWRVTGLDRQLGMLRFLRQAARSRGVEVAGVCADMTRFGMRRQDAAYCPLGSFHLLADEEQAVAHLRDVAAALTVIGIYVLELVFNRDHTAPPTPLDTWTMTRGTVRVDAAPSGIVATETESDERLDLDWGGTLRPYSPASFSSLLDRAGVLRLAAVYPEHQTTPEGISVFDIRRRIATPRPGPAVVVLRPA